MLAQEELCAPTRAPDDSNIEGYNNYHCSIVPGMNIDADVGEGNVDGDPPKRSEYDQITKGEAITITKVLAGTDVKEKDNTVIVATESDTHIKIIGLTAATIMTVTTGMSMTFGMRTWRSSLELAWLPKAICRHARRCFELGISCSLGSRREASSQRSTPSPWTIITPLTATTTISTTTSKFRTWALS